MRNRAAPIGMSVTVSVFSEDFTGLGWSVPTMANLSACQFVIFFALPLIVIGVVSAVNGFFVTEPHLRFTSNEESGLVSSKRSPSVSYTHLRAHETPEHLVCRLLL